MAASTSAARPSDPTRSIQAARASPPSPRSTRHDEPAPSGCEAQTSQRLRTMPQASTAPEIQRALLPPLALAFPDKLLKPIHLARADDCFIHHPAHEFLDGSPTKPVDNLPHSMRRQTPRIRCPPRGKINVRSPLLLMPQIPLLLQPPQECPHRGFLNIPPLRDDL